MFKRPNVNNREGKRDLRGSFSKTGKGEDDCHILSIFYYYYYVSTTLLIYFSIHF